MRCAQEAAVSRELATDYRNVQPLLGSTATQSDSDLQGGHRLSILSKECNSGLLKYPIFITPKNKAQIRVCSEFPCNVKYLLMQLRQNSRIVSFIVNNHDRTDETIIQREYNGVSCRREQPNRCHRIYESIWSASCSSGRLALYEPFTELAFTLVSLSCLSILSVVSLLSFGVGRVNSARPGGLPCQCAQLGTVTIQVELDLETLIIRVMIPETVALAAMISRLRMSSCQCQ